MTAMLFVRPERASEVGVNATDGAGVDGSVGPFDFDRNYLSGHNRMYFACDFLIDFVKKVKSVLAYLALTAMDLCHTLRKAISRIKR
jgi:hypothetical protein